MPSSRSVLFRHQIRSNPPLHLAVSRRASAAREWRHPDASNQIPLPSIISGHPSDKHYSVSPLNSIDCQHNRAIAGARLTNPSLRGGGPPPPSTKKKTTALT